MIMQKHFVEFYSPGTFFAETSEKPIEAWDVSAAEGMARGIKERHGAIPYAFRFLTKTRTDEDLDSKETARSPYYFLGGTVETLEQVKARATEKDRILVSNMEYNGYARIVTNNNSWRWTQPLRDEDIVLDWDSVK